MKSKVLRHVFPRVRQIVRGETLRYIIDARHTSPLTNKPAGKLYERGSKDEAINLAQQIAAEHSDGGVITAEERTHFTFFRNRCLQLNIPLKDALEKAIRYYNKKEQNKEERQSIAELADLWLEARKSGQGGRVKNPRPATLREMEHTRNLLVKKWGGIKYSSLKKDSIKEFLQSIPHAMTAKKWRVRISGFANWVIDEGLAYGAGNPAKGISDQKPDEHLPEILTAEKAKQLISLCEENRKLTPLIHHIALGLFAGMRPKEAERISKKDVELWHKPNESKWGSVWGRIVIKSYVAKTRRERHVPINETLYRFLKQYEHIPIHTPTNHRKRMEALRKAAGYCYGKDADPSTSWKSDVLRHSYATYWLMKFNDEPALAFRMGNSVDVIRRFYVRPIAEYVAKEYWEISPNGIASPSQSDGEEGDA